MMHRFLIVLAVFVLATTAFAQETTVIGGDEEGLRRYIERANIAHFIRDTDVTVYIEALPADLPLSLPLPDDIDMIASTTIQESGVTGWRIIADAPMTLDEVFAFYRENLDTAFSPVDMSSRPGGFTSDRAFRSEVYCYNEDEYSFHVGGVDSDENVSQLDITLSEGEGRGNICGMSNMENPYDTLASDLPSLAPPQGNRVTTRGAGSNMDYAVSRARIIGTEDATLGSLLNTFNTQIGEQGWSLDISDVTEAGAWSTWETTIDDEAYTGYLLILENPAEDGVFDAQFTLYRLGEAE